MTFCSILVVGANVAICPNVYLLDLNRSNAFSLILFFIQCILLTIKAVCIENICTCQYRLHFLLYFCFINNGNPVYIRVMIAFERFRKEKKELPKTTYTIRTVPVLLWTKDNCFRCRRFNLLQPIKAQSFCLH